MPFRARLKKVFGRTSSGSSEGSMTPSGHPIEYYKPGEVPRSKYRGPWNQEHQDKLSSFNFAWGRKTSVHGSEYSPAQTRAQSRAQSRAHSRRSSWMSVARRPSTKGSVSGKSDSGKKSERVPSRVGQVPEAEGEETDVLNVGMSRRQTREKRGASFGADLSSDDEEDEEGDKEDDVRNELEQQETVVLPPNGDGLNRPFTEEELTQAFTAATLRPKSGGSRR